MKIFVTGASGFIGSRLTGRLLKENHDVTVLLRDRTFEEIFRKKGATVVYGDLFNVESLRKGMNGCDWVFHLAAYARPTSVDQNLPFRINVGGTVNILSASKDEKIKRVIITSSAATMGFSRNGAPVDEETNKNPVFNTEYEKTKILSEQIAIENASDSMEVIIVNPTRVFGPGRMSVSNSVTKIINMYGKGLWRIIPGTGEEIGNYAFIDDVVNGHVLAALQGKNRERYILGGENISFRNFFEVLGKVYGSNRILININGANLKRIAHLANFFTDLAGKSPVISENWIDKYLNNWIISSNKAKQELSYSITPFEKAVEKTVEWLKGRKDHNET